MGEGRRQPPSGEVPEPVSRRARRPGHGVRDDSRPPAQPLTGPTMAGFNRDTLAQRVAGFDRLADDLGGRKPAAVAIAVVEDDDGPGFLVTKRPDTMRAHPG